MVDRHCDPGVQVMWCNEGLFSRVKLLKVVFIFRSLYLHNVEDGNSFDLGKTFLLCIFLNRLLRSVVIISFILFPGFKCYI